ncbi:hypothetical protein ARMGADRAFT_75218 [Armillaria gallica]|uniref:Uncharacterized protein n=1 Tax=Armillaria gallica TaxID=47427 RepID=A0A2H3CBX8_ARMGA|nr:hypothetical protein ARMGADRAFT_75218 [Armillaria gallica]
MCSARCRLLKKHSSHNAEYTPSMRIISVDMMIDDNCWLIGSMVVVGCSKCCNCGDPGCRVYPFYTVRSYAHVLTCLRHGFRRNMYPRLPVLRIWSFELKGGIFGSTEVSSSISSKGAMARRQSRRAVNPCPTAAVGDECCVIMFGARRQRVEMGFSVVFDSFRSSLTT